MPDPARPDLHRFETEAIGHLQALLRLDTTNPPGNETAAAEYLAGVLRAEGYAAEVIEPAPGRGSVVARLAGSGELPPLLLYGHTDVVTAEAEYWSHPPFSGAVEDGCIWGRGALDMKGMVAQELMTMLLLKRADARLRRDVIFAATADEEAGGQAGMGYLVDHHPELIRAEYGLSEGGGTTTYLANRAFYDVRTAEKGTCRFHLRAFGRPGHGSVPRPNTAVARVAEAVVRLTESPLPFRATLTIEAFFARLVELLDVAPGRRRLTEDNLNAALQQLPAGFRQYMHAVTHDTAVPTGLHAGRKINVMPSEATAWVDGRYLPGQTVDGFLSEVTALIGDGVELRPVDLSDPLEDPPGGPLYDAILSVMAHHAPDAPVVPLMLSGATDAKHVARLGTRCLGFGPVRIDEEFPADQLMHGHDERIPADGYLWGTRVLHDIVALVCR